MGIVIMKDNWEDFKKGNTSYLKALNEEEIAYYSPLSERLVELYVADTDKPALADEYLACLTGWFNTACEFVNLPQRMMLNWLRAVHDVGKQFEGMNSQHILRCPE